jgi:hypothetical protein
MTRSDVKSALANEQTGMCVTRTNGVQVSGWTQQYGIEAVMVKEDRRRGSNNNFLSLLAIGLSAV